MRRFAFAVAALLVVACGEDHERKRSRDPEAPAAPEDTAAEARCVPAFTLEGSLNAKHFALTDCDVIGDAAPSFSAFSNMNVTPRGEVISGSVSRSGIGDRLDDTPRFVAVRFADVIHADGGSAPAALEIHADDLHIGSCREQDLPGRIDFSSYGAATFAFAALHELDANGDCGVPIAGSIKGTWRERD